MVQSYHLYIVKSMSMEKVVKEYQYGTDRVVLYKTYIEVSLSCTSTSVLDSIIFSYSEVVFLHPIDIINVAWEVHTELIDSMFGSTLSSYDE